MKKKLEKIIINALKELNESLDEKIEVKEGMDLLEGDSVLDSLDFVSLMVIIEEKISDELNRDITIVDEKAFSRKNSPFKNTDTLTEFLQEILEEK